MHEPAVTLTDFALAGECAVLAASMLRGRKPRSAARNWAALFFGAIGLAALLGGVVHGFLPDESSPVRSLLWRLTLVAIGAAALGAWALAANVLTSRRVARLVEFASGALLCVYVAVILFVFDGFLIAIINYAPAMGFLLVAAVAAYRQERRPAALIGAAGIMLTFGASYVQAARVAVHPVYFDHNALYHVLQAIALAMIFVWTHTLRAGARPGLVGGRT